MRWILSFLVCWSASAQLPVMPYVVPNAGISFDLTGVFEHWSSKDLTTNVAIAGNWSGEIQALNWKMAAVTLQPTNGAQFGVWTDSTHWLTNAGQANAGITGMGSNIAFGFTVNIIDCGFFSSLTRPSFWGNGDASTKTYRIGFDSNNSYWMESVGDGTVEWGAGIAPWRATNTLVDIVWNQVVTNNNSYGIYVYTNGVLVSSSGLNDGKYFGSLNTSFFLPNALLIMGHDNLRNNGPKMYWSDIVCWTNGAPGDANGVKLSATQVANYHKWSTNTYKFSP